MNAHDVYKENSITTQSKGRLIVMLYEGAIKFMKLAIENIEQKDYEAKNNYLIRAQNIITELNAVLDVEAGGEIAENLRKLYVFMLNHLRKADFQSLQHQNCSNRRNSKFVESKPQ